MLKCTSQRDAKMAAAAAAVYIRKMKAVILMHVQNGGSCISTCMQNRIQNVQKPWKGISV